MIDSDIIAGKDKWYTADSGAEGKGSAPAVAPLSSSSLDTGPMAWDISSSRWSARGGQAQFLLLYVIV